LPLATQRKYQNFLYVVINMQTFEAIISLLFFVWMLTLALLSFEAPELNYQVYQMQLSSDVWRVLYLRGNFEDLSDMQSIEPDINQLGSITGLCFFLDGIETTNCRGGVNNHNLSVSSYCTIIFNHEPKTIKFSMGN
jgi:hypothetical protein